MAHARLFRSIRFEYRIAFIYFLLGFTWIYFSDTFFGSIIKDKDYLVSINIIKGVAYIIITTILLFILVRRHIRELNRAERIIKEHSLELEEQNIEYKQLNDELQKAKEGVEASNNLKTTFLHNISHEIRTPMNAIVGFSDLLDNPDLAPGKRERYISIIQNSSHQLLSIVTDILTISTLETKQEKINITPVCVNSVILDLLAIFKNQSMDRNISLVAKPQLINRLSTIYTDQTKLAQILTNLIMNAVKFTREGEIEFGYTRKDNELEFYVKDTGIGIKQDVIGTVFDRFRQADESIRVEYGGTGLGLSISKGFIELLGGEIWVTSEFGKGTTFYFTIPYNVVGDSGGNPATPKQHGIAVKTKYTILIAEDDESNYLYMREVLHEIGFEVLRSVNGKQAVEMCKTNPAVDLVLMDIKMPVMNGYDAAKQIKEYRPNLPIIAQTAYAMEYEKDKFGGTTFDDYMTKPINLDKLRRVLVKYANL